jgi:hypothetical protein
MHKKLGFAATLVLLTAALTAPHVEASTCTQTCATQQHNCFIACAGNGDCNANCSDQYNACMGNICHVYI